MPDRKELLRYKYHCHFDIEVTTNPNPEVEAFERRPWSYDITDAAAKLCGGAVCGAFEGGITLPLTDEAREACAAMDVTIYRSARELRFNRIKGTWILRGKDELPFTLEEIRQVRSALYQAGKIETKLIYVQYNM